MMLNLENTPDALNPPELSLLEKLRAGGAISLTSAPGFDELIQPHFNQWEVIQARFHKDFKSLNKLLLKIHHERAARLDANQRHNVLKFLCIGYLISKDVRYFNEFLWFNKDLPNTSNLKTIILYQFKQNINKDFTHNLPHLNQKEVASIMDEMMSVSENVGDKKEGKPLEIGILGIPFIFKRVYSQLSQSGHNLQMFMIPYYDSWKRRLFLKSGFIFNLFCKLKGVTFPYRTLNLNPTDQTIKKVLTEKKLDLGIFKLGFIVKENIYSAFNIGLLHDHLAILPFIRGRSSMEFSLLQGIPPGSTMHFIHKGIDSGEIVSLFPYHFQKGQSLKEIRQKIKNDFGQRILKSVELISANPNHQIPNNTNLGLSYYSMHPSLTKYIEEYILRLK
jgi:folate-dependent phosphoribosylglycinamide formyltransferase PurN